jgi:hypothetical protein
VLTLSEADIAAHLSEPTTLPCQHLLDAVLAAAHPYQDNATVILVQAAAWIIGSRWQAWLAILLAALLILGGFWWYSSGKDVFLSNNRPGETANRLAAMVASDWEKLP